MHIISRKPIREFCKIHPKTESSLERWFKIVEKARWKSFEDVRKTFSSADRVGEFLIFNIGGNNYRLIARLKDYCQFQDNGLLNNAAIFIKKICTHDEYSKLIIPDDLKDR